MLKLMIGIKGTGKTKTLIQKANDAAAASKGDVVCLEKGSNLRFEIKPTVRLVNTDEYFVTDAQSLFGFLAGILASNHDVTDVFVDASLKICKNDLVAYDKFVDEVAAIADKLGIEIFMTASIPVEDASDTVKKYL